MADVHHEVAEESLSVGGVVHLGVELNGVGGLALDVVAGIFHVVGGADAVVVGGDLLDGVAVAHPYLASGGDAFHERRLGVDELEVGTAVFADLRLLDLSAAPFGEILSAVAYGEERQAALDVGHVGHGSVGCVAAVWATGKNHTFDVGSELRNFVKRMNFTINIKFANFACNQLSVLRTKV